MERLANYQQMVDPTMVWGLIKSNDAVRMDVSFTWKKEEWLIFIGPDGGKNGGEVVFTGTPLMMIQKASTLTAQCLRLSCGLDSVNI